MFSQLLLIIPGFMLLGFGTACLIGELSAIAEHEVFRTGSRQHQYSRFLLGIGCIVLGITQIVYAMFSEFCLYGLAQEDLHLMLFFGCTLGVMLILYGAMESNSKLIQMYFFRRARAAQDSLEDSDEPDTFHVLAPNHKDH